jgi:hypothetical protein
LGQLGDGEEDDLLELTEVGAFHRINDLLSGRAS